MTRSYTKRSNPVCLHCGTKLTGDRAYRQLYCDRTCSADHKRGSGDKGYVKRGGRHEHRAVAEKTIGRLLRDGEIVHHIDGNPHNNDPSNLEVMTQAEHARLHSTGQSHKWKQCKNGHDLIGDNVKILSNGFRRCRLCYNTYHREYRKRHG